MMIGIIDEICSNSGTGMLLSGGCDSHGRVPISAKASAVRYAAGKGLEINAHAGFIEGEEAAELVHSGVKMFSADIHQDPAVIREVLNLKRSPEEYGDMIRNITDAGGTVVPHLTIGLGDRDLLGSARLVKDAGLKNVIILTLVPTEGTMFQDMVLNEDRVLSDIGQLKDMGFDLTLGCMRDRRMRGLEIRCIEMGIRRVANLSLAAEKWALDQGYSVVTEERCCCMPQRMDSFF